MTWETALRARILADAGVLALVADDDAGNPMVDWSVMRLKGRYPAVVLTLVFDARPQDLDGVTGLRSSTVQIDIYGRERAQVVPLREAVIAAISGPYTQGGVQFGRAFIQSVRDLGDDSAAEFVHRDSIDAQIWHT